MWLVYPSQRKINNKKGKITSRENNFHVKRISHNSKEVHVLNLRRAFNGDNSMGFFIYKTNLMICHNSLALTLVSEYPQLLKCHLQRWSYHKFDEGLTTPSEGCLQMFP